MRIGFVVNDVQTEQAEYTTTRLALAATTMGHEAWLIGVGDFVHHADGVVGASARAASGKAYRSGESYLANLQGAKGKQERIVVDDLDVLMMRNDPADDATDRPWAVASGILLAQLGVTRGVLVVNDPFSLANAINKTYFQHFPEHVRPRTMVSREHKELAAFVDSVGGSAILKPLQGSGGASVFKASTNDASNLNQMLEAISRDGYIVAQEYLAEATKGDARIFVMNGEPLRIGSSYAAFRRVNSAADIRSNMHVGGKARRLKLTDAMLAVCETVRPKLIADGMFLVGLDIVGDKMMEVNVFSPGGLGSCQALYDVDFASAVIEALEQ